MISASIASIPAPRSRGRRTEVSFLFIRFPFRVQLLFSLYFVRQSLRLPCLSWFDSRFNFILELLFLDFKFFSGILFNVLNLTRLWELFLYLIVKFVKNFFLLKIWFLENLKMCVKFLVLFHFFTICKFISNAYLDLKKRDDIFYYQALIMFLLN